MGRQRSTKVLDNIANTSRAGLVSALATVNSVRNQITKMSDSDVNQLFGKSRQSVLNALDTSGLDRSNLAAYRSAAVDLLGSLKDIVDTGLERNIVNYLNGDVLAREYASRLQSELSESSRSEIYDASRVSREPSGYETYSGRDYEAMPTRRVSETRIPEARTPRTIRVPETRTPTSLQRVEITRIPEGARVPTAPYVPQTPPYAPIVPSPTPPYPPPPPLYPPPETPPPPEIPPPPPPPVGKSRIIAASPAGVPVAEGSIVFAFGAKLEGEGVGRVKRPVWKVIGPDDFRDGAKPQTLYSPPHGAKNIDSTSPYDTIQVIGRSRTANVPERVSIDLGVTDAFVTDFGQSISFKGKGTKTDVGGRIPSPTQGMELDGSSYDTSAALVKVKAQGVSRVRVNPRTSRRKGKKSNWRGDLTSMKGFRP